MVLYSNLSKIDIGTFIGERFLYQPSFGFCIVLVVLFNEIIDKIKFKDIASKFSVVTTLVVAIVLLSGFQTIRRNAEWQSDTTLWPIDVKAVPNSARAQNGCGMAQILLTNDLEDSVKKLLLLHEAISHLKRAHEIQPKYIDPWLNMGVAYSRLENYDSTEYCWNKARQLDSTHPMLVVQYEPVLAIDFMNQGLKAGGYKDYSSSIRYFNRALKYNKKNADVWYNLGGAYYTIGRYDSAAISWQQCLKLKPGYTKAKQGLQALMVKKSGGQ
jgi:tetratricopeptide (TPR) repeat protein